MLEEAVTQTRVLREDVEQGRDIYPGGEYEMLRVREEMWPDSE